jgi:hypothetical protein
MEEKKTMIEVDDQSNQHSEPGSQVRVMTWCEFKAYSTEQSHRHPHVVPGVGEFAGEYYLIEPDGDEAIVLGDGSSFYTSKCFRIEVRETKCCEIIEPVKGDIEACVVKCPVVDLCGQGKTLGTAVNSLRSVVKNHIGAYVEFYEKAQK